MSSCPGKRAQAARIKQLLAIAAELRVPSSLRAQTIALAQRRTSQVSALDAFVVIIDGIERAMRRLGSMQGGADLCHRVVRCVRGPRLGKSQCQGEEYDGPNEAHG